MTLPGTNLLYSTDIIVLLKRSAFVQTMSKVFNLDIVVLSYESQHYLMFSVSSFGTIYGIHIS